MAATITEGVLWELQADDSQLVAAYRRAESASARAGESAARSAKKSEAAYEGLKTKVEFASGALKDNSAAIGLNRAQMLESIHVAKSFVDQIIAGQSPLRAMAVEGGRIAQIFSSGSGGAGATARAFGGIALRALTSPVGAAITLSAAVLGVKAAGDAAAEALATLGEEARQTGLSPNRVAGAKIVGARAGLDDKQTVDAFANAQKQFDAYARNAGAVKDILEKIDKSFLSVADGAHNVSEWIDRIVQKIQELPRDQGLNLSKALFGDEAGRKLFDEIQRGSVSMASLSQEAEKAGANFDISAQHAESMKNQIAEAEKIASTKLLAAFGDLATPSLAIERAWANVKGSIADAVKGARDLIDAPALRKVQSQREGALAGAEIGRLVTGKDPFAGKRFSDVDPLINLFTQGQKPRTVGEDRSLFEPADRKGGSRGVSDAERAAEKYAEITRHLQEQITLLNTQGQEHDDIVLKMKIEAKQAELGKAATQGQNDNIAALVTKLDDAERAQKRLTEQAQALKQAYNEVGSAISQTFKQWLAGDKTQSRDVLRSLGGKFSGDLLEAGLTGSGPFAKLLGTEEKNGAGGGLFGFAAGLLGLGGDKSAQTVNVKGSTVNVAGGQGGLVGEAGGLFSNLFGATGQGGILSKVTDFFSGFFAEGGDVPAGHWGVAGEKGPELVRGPATVTPFSKLARTPRAESQAPTVIHFNVTSPDAPSFVRSEAQVSSLLTRALVRGQRNL